MQLNCFRLLLIFVLFINISFAQQEIIRRQVQVDSLNSLLKSKSHDTSRVIWMNELGRVKIQQDKFDEAMAHALDAKKLSEKKNFGRGKAFSQIVIGEVHRSKGELHKAITSFNLALQLAKKSKALSYEALVYDQLGHVNRSNGDLLNAMKYHQKSLEVSQKSNELIHQANSHANLAEILFPMGKISEAEVHYSAALKIFQELNIVTRIAWAAGNSGLMNRSLGDTKKAMQLFFISLNKFEEENNLEGIVWINNRISITYLDILEVDKALIYVNKALEAANKKGKKSLIAECYAVKGNIYHHIKDFDKSRELFGSSLKLYTSIQDSAGIVDALMTLGRVYYDMGNYDISLSTLRKSRDISQSINSMQMVAAAKMYIALNYIAQNNTTKAKSNLLKALQIFTKRKDVTQLHFIYRNLVKVDSMDGNFQGAFENYKLFLKHKNETKIERSEAEKVAMRYEFEKKQALATAELKNKQTQRNAAILGLILTTTLVIVLVYVFRLRNKKIKIEKEKLELQKRDIERIKETEQFKSRFLTNITHEFRTPLTLIKGHLEVLREKGREEDQKRFQEMDANGSRLLQLINQLLDLSKMESGSYQLNYHSGDVVHESIALVQAFQSLSDQKGIKLIVNKEIHQDADSTHFVYSQEALAIITSNLLSNAFKYTPTGGTVIVDINLRDNNLTLRIKDTGKGISKNHLPNVFERFYQVDEPGQQVYEGSGVGLALVKELALIHGGNVSVESPEKEGCTFTVVLKSASEQATSSPSEIHPQENPVQQVKDPKVKNKVENNLPLILVVEDQTELRRFIIDNLGLEYQYAEAINGKEGIKLAEELMPDLIISDVMMPEVDGLALCQHLKGNMSTSHIPIILLTAKADDVDKLQGLETGANDYLTKPFSLAEIRLRIKNILNLSLLLQRKFEGVTIPKLEETPELNARDREFIEKIHEVIQSQISNSQFGVQVLADSLFLSSSQFSRKLKSITGKTPAEYIRDFKLQKAIEILKTGSSVAETGWEVGFEDPVYFSKVFKKHVGFPPSEVKKM